MIVSKTKRRLTRFDEMTLPAMEKMLPPEALVKKETPVINERKTFPRLAVASLAIVALVVATALVIGSVAGGNEKQIDPDNSLVLNNDSENTSIPSVLENEASDNEVSTEYTSTEEGEVSRKDMPIVSCGKYTNTMSNNSGSSVGVGEVALGTMLGTRIEISKLEDDVLYAISFTAAYTKSPEYIEGMERIERETREKCPNGLTDEAILERNAQMEALSKEIRKKTSDKMYEYLESIGVDFYDKNVYFYNPLSKDYNYREKAYRIAFLTKDEIESLKGGEDYGILARIVCEELAKMDNEPVYLNAIVVVPT